METINKVKNIRNIPRLPRLGVLRLGAKDKSGKAYETDYFIIDAEAKDIARKAQDIYGEKPRELKVTFYTDDIGEVFICKYQRWGESGNHTPYLLCEGNGEIAFEKGERQEKSCPCSHLGRNCRKKTILRVMLPEISMGGYFTLVTKSEHNARMIETAIRVIQKQPGGLIMRPMKLLRSEGYVNVKDFRVKKHFVCLVPDESNRVETPSVESEGPMAKLIGNELQKLALEAGKSTEIPAIEFFEQLKVKDRCEEGRRKIKEKIKLHIRDPRSAQAIELYACRRFNKNSFDALSIEELIILWRDVDDRALISDVYALTQETVR